MSYAVLFIDTWPRRIRDTLISCIPSARVGLTFCPPHAGGQTLNPKITQTLNAQNQVKDNVLPTCFSLETQMSVYADGNVSGELSIMSKHVAPELFDPRYHSVETGQRLLL